MRDCQDCLIEMERVVVKKGTYFKRGTYMYRCKGCKKEETVIGDGKREESIVNGFHDEEIGIVKNNFDI